MLRRLLVTMVMMVLFVALAEAHGATKDLL